jgi:hypothetical protein
MQTKWIRAAVAGALSGAAMLATAGTVNLSAWTFSPGNVAVTITGAGNVYAGGFSGTLSGFGSPYDGAFQTYCVEITEHFSLPSGNMSGYQILSPIAYGEWGSNTPAIAARIGQLVTYVHENPGVVANSSQSAALQLAIWNTIYDTDSTLQSGTFKETSSNGTFRAYADTLLHDSLLTVSALNVSVVAKSGSQDFLVTTPIPEPGTLALMTAGFAGLGFSARRRRSKVTA